jgi:DNA-binding NtrC family response regulator
MSGSERARVLLVEDEPNSREATQLFLEDDGFDIIAVASGRKAIEHFTDGICAIVTDLEMPGMDGIELLRIAREEIPHAPVIVLTGHGSETLAVSALKSGAFHYVTKPANPHELAHLVRQACEKSRLAARIAALHRELQEKYGFANILGTSKAMRRVFETIRMVADTRSTVLIVGESGTGKELVARALHYTSARRDRPFVALNCAALPETLVESELFGHEKGAFTGATERRAGKFRSANGGTLLIDEIGEMPFGLQSKLLRTIESHTVAPIGRSAEVPVDVRIVASTNRNLEALVAEGKFREDLYYRLNVVKIELPPLRERPEDIPILVHAFVKQLARENDQSPRDVTPEALAQLQGYDWPGNVRQLRNTLESILVTSTGDVIDVPHLPEPIAGARPHRASRALVKPRLSLDELEREAIRLALEETGRCRTEASKLLGISVRTLQRKIREYGL